jgi:putative hydrolase of the HAD superfamily
MPDPVSVPPANPRLRFVFLDVGETLLRVTQPGATYRAILADHGYDVPAETLDAAIRELFKALDTVLPRQRNPDHTISAELAQLRRERLIEGVLERVGVDPAHAQAAAEGFRQSWIGTGIFQMYPDVPPTLELLRAAGYRLGIVSNWEPRLPQLCDSHGIGHHFEFAVVSETEGYVKPHPRLFERALELAGVGPEAVVHVGDSYPEDIEGAQAAGIRAVLIDRKGAARVPYSPTIQSLAELPAVLAAL